MSEKTQIRKVQDLDVYRAAVAEAMRIFIASKSFPREETYSLTDQIRRSSRSVAANIAEAWRKRRYVAAFVSKLSDAETEAAETQTWIEFAVKCDYLSRSDGASFFKGYDGIIGRIIRMIEGCDSWVIRPPSSRNSPRPPAAVSPRQGDLE